MLGNDVVDLRDAAGRSDRYRPGFDECAFSEQERRAIARDSDPTARRFSHWGAKQAAFRLCHQIDPNFIFSPSCLAVEFEPIRSERNHGVVPRVERCGIVRLIDDSNLAPIAVEVRSIETEEFVHVIATLVGADWQAIDCAVEPLDAAESDPGAAVRALALREISRSLGIAIERLAIGVRKASTSGWQGGPPRAEADALLSLRIPIVELDGVPTSLALCLAHHGRFVSFAMSPLIEAVTPLRRPDARTGSPSIAGATQS